MIHEYLGSWDGDDHEVLELDISQVVTVTIPSTLDARTSPACMHVDTDTTTTTISISISDQMDHIVNNDTLGRASFCLTSSAISYGIVVVVV